jgi:hypothetical protein
MKTLHIRHTACMLLIVLGLTGTSCAQDKERLVNLAGDWRFNLGDNMKYAKPDYDDSDWEHIVVPSNWHREGFRNYHGFAWYRKKVSFAFEKGDALYLELGKIDDVDEVYVNGRLIGRTGGFPPDYYTGYNYSRRYLIPEEYVQNNGKNIIAIRVYDEGGEGGILGTNVGIYKYRNFSENSLHLFGKWKFRLGDDKKWAAANVNDVDWEDVIVPSSWESQGFQNYDGFAWYRKTFKVPDNYSAEDLMIVLGKIDDLDEVYLNGSLIGSTGRIERGWASNDEYDQYRNYHIPDGLLKPGKFNVIAVRVFDQTGDGGIYEGPVTLLPQKEYKEFWRTYRMNSLNNGNSFLNWLSYYID